MPLVKYGPPPKKRGMRRLLGDFGMTGGAGAGAGAAGEAGASGGGGEGGGASSASRATSRKGSYISFWKPEVRLGLGGGGVMVDVDVYVKCCLLYADNDEKLFSFTGWESLSTGERSAGVVAKTIKGV